MSEEPVSWIEQPEPVLRFVRRYEIVNGDIKEQRILQQRFTLKSCWDPTLAQWKMEWRDVPLVDEEKEGGEP